MRTPLIAGNWKMHGSREQVRALLSALLPLAPSYDSVEFAVMPPAVFLPQVASMLSGSVVRYGAQDVSDEAAGAFTGEIAADMLAELGCQYVIVGHSERRARHGETNACVARKSMAAWAADLIPVICVGETLAQREADETLHIVEQQLAAVLTLADNLPSLPQMVVAYEPVWAIGTGKVATPEQAQAVHEAIRKQLHAKDAVLASETRILYGGSVKPSNAKALFEMPDIDGALVGGASLVAEQFIQIGASCNS